MSERYVIVLETVNDDPPPIVRIRRALKVLRRAFDFRLVAIDKEKPAEAPPEHAGKVAARA